MPSGFETFADALGIKFNPYMNSIGEKFVNGETPKVAVRAGRRTGKTSMLIAVALYEACLNKDSDIMVQVVSNRAATYLTDVIISTVNTSALRRTTQTSIEFVNGSTIRIMQPVRGISRPDVVLVDEAAFVENFDYGLSKTLIVSTPSEFTSRFNTVMRHDDLYAKYHIPNEDMSPGTVALGPHDIVERLGELPEFEISDSVLHIHHDVPEHDLVLRTYDDYIGTDTIEPVFHHTIPLEPQHIIPIGETNQIISEDVHYYTSDNILMFDGTQSVWVGDDHNHSANVVLDSDQIAELQRRTLEVGDVTWLDDAHTHGVRTNRAGEEIHFHDIYGREPEVWNTATPTFAREIRAAWNHRLTDTMEQQPQDDMSAEQILGEIDGRTHNYDTGSA